MNLDVKIRVIRALRDLSQDALAEMTGIARPQLSAFERGQALPNSDYAARIRQALGWDDAVDKALDALLEAAWQTDTECVE